MPLHDMSKSMPPAALRGRSPRAGVPGEEHPRHPLRRLGSLHARQGPWLRRCAPAGRTNPLTRTPLEKLTTKLLRSQKSKAKAAQKGKE
jgi:hypothetical protein